MCILCLQFISAHNVLSTIKKMSTIYIHHIHIHHDMVHIQRVTILTEYLGNVDLTKKLTNNLISLKNLKTLLLTD